MISTVHVPFDDRIFYKESKSLAKRYKVTLIAPSNSNFCDYSNGIRIITIKKPKSKWLHPITLWQIFREGYKQNCDVYHCHELGSLIICLIIKKMKKCKVIYDIHEHWPSQIPQDLGLFYDSAINRIVQKIVLKIELFCSKRSDALITVSNSVADRFNKIGLKPVIIPNVPVLSYSNNLSYSGDDYQKLVYMGGKLQTSDGIKECVNAMIKLKEYFPKITLTIIGKLDFEIKEITANKKALQSIIITGVLPYDEMYKQIHKGGIGLINFKPDYYNKYIGLPNKLFDYMSCGLPIVASNFPEIKKVINEAKCGLLINPTDENEIVEAIKYMIEHPEVTKKMGENGRKAVEEKYSWDVIENRLFAVYNSLM